MRRWVSFLICAILGLALVVCGLLVPAHLRAINASVLARSGAKTPTLVEIAWSEGRADRPGAARLLSRAADKARLRGADTLQAAVLALDREHPGWAPWGGRPPAIPIDPKLAIRLADADLPPATNAGSTDPTPTPFVEILVPEQNREAILGGLKGSTKVAVQELLQSRTLTNTVLFSPSRSASGQAFDAAVALSGLLLDSGYMTPGLSNGLFSLAFDANHGANPQRFEQSLADLLTLGQKLDWNQLVALTLRLQDPESLRLLANLLRPEQANLPVVYSATLMASNPRAVIDYLMKFSRTGVDDLASTMRYGRGALDLLTAEQKRFHFAHFGPPPALLPVEDAFAAVAWSSPGVAFALKWFFYIAGGFLLALTAHFLVQWRAERTENAPRTPFVVQPIAYRSGHSPVPAPARSRAGIRLMPNFHFAREALFSLGFLLVILLLTEPFMADEVQKTEMPFHFRLPTVGSIIPAANHQVHSSFMNQLSLLTLLLFFVIQALLYVASLVKIAEIRRQRVPARTRLRLLENEDHLFDAGLYLGFVGTIISLILVSLGVIKPSLMAAYSSTSFGIIFVSAFKIFHLRPLRRKLVLEAESAAMETGFTPGGQTAVTTS